ncbi:hypothetical protein PRIPAC_90432, partial [Pristionchus pacificus]
MSRKVARALLSTIARGSRLTTGTRPICSLPTMVTSTARAGTVGGGVKDPALLPKEIRTSAFFDFERVEPNVFRAANLSTSGQQSPHAAYGGLIMAQALAAAEATVTEEFKPHSMHSFFILNVDTTVPVDYHVRLLRDGRSFCTRSVEAIQKGKVVFCLQTSFHVVEPDSCVHQSDYPKVVKPADECPELSLSSKELLDRIASGEVKGSEHTRAAIVKHSQIDRTQWLFDIRCTDTAALFGLGDPTRTFYFWMKARVPLSTADDRLHRWMIVFASDSTPVGVIFRPHTKNDFTPSMVFSLDHVMHFHHHEIRADEWMLYEVESTVAGAGRGFARGRIWGTDGKLLVSLTQEALGSITVGYGGLVLTTGWTRSVCKCLEKRSTRSSMQLHRYKCTIRSRNDDTERDTTHYEVTTSIVYDISGPGKSFTTLIPKYSTFRSVGPSFTFPSSPPRERGNRKRLDVGRHKIRQEKISMYDFALGIFKRVLEEVQQGVGIVLPESFKEFTEAPKNPRPKGWALRSTKKTGRYDPVARKLVDDLFEQYFSNGKKLRPDEAEKRMRERNDILPAQRMTFDQIRNRITTLLSQKKEHQRKEHGNRQRRY